MTTSSLARSAAHWPAPFGRACGKVILLGEHAVVFGVPALAVGIDRGAQARVVAIPSGPSRLRVCGWDIDVSENDEERDLSRAFRALLATTRHAQSLGRCAAIGPVLVEARAALPPGGGLGCSAALGVAVARALDPSVSEGDAAYRATAWERVFHGNPSGVDAAVAASGGCVLFEKGHGLEHVRIRGGITLCVGHSGSASSTKVMVDAVAKLRARRPELVDEAFEEIRSLVRQARHAVESGDRGALGRLMNANQAVLGRLMVSTPDLDQMCALARGAGAVGAKLTGAGGGGCVVALVVTPSAVDDVLASWRGAGFEGFATNVAMSDHVAARELGAVP